MFKKLLFAFYMPILVVVLFMASSAFVMNYEYESIKGNVTKSVTSAAESIADQKIKGLNLTFQDVKNLCLSSATFPEEYKEYESVCEAVKKGEITSINGVVALVVKNELETQVFSKIEEQLKNASPIFILMYLIGAGSYAIYIFFLYSVKKESIVYYVAVAVALIFLLSVALGVIEQHVSNALASDVIKNAPPEIRGEAMNALVEIKDNVLSKLGDAFFITSFLILAPLGVWALIRISLPTR